ncbi:MAG: deoxynucleoside kinase [Anaerolineales bacterium]|nr:deoxynucleoside kinase [Anaerolineales bacterium]MCS7248704.1 deoxynucleoside kinase [Anaerolineales bacterium]MDW8162517.1 deoxynucleoside kinase [Anaerolineales bacterium]MDW8445698.1 deoxynucleoside kinase [Anaerolineales bacterium]
MKRFIAVSGNIGVGKSTLVRLLSQRLGWKAFYEPVAENPYLADFYQDMRRWAFHSQIFFLIQRLRAHRQLSLYPSSVLQDRTVYEDAEVFARNLYLQGFIQQRDYDTYSELYQVLCESLPPPDLLIYLRAPVRVLHERILQRGREYERRISLDYLCQLDALYEEWIASFSLCPVLTISTSDINYVTEPQHLEMILGKIHEMLSGKETVSLGEFDQD